MSGLNNTARTTAKARRVFQYVLTKQETHLAPFGIYLRVDCSRVGRIHDNRRVINAVGAWPPRANRELR
jgi:uncharacterized protein YwbE